MILVTGVNGAGKTTSIAKLCHTLRSQETCVLLGACDTFRGRGQTTRDLGRASRCRSRQGAAGGGSRRRRLRCLRRSQSPGRRRSHPRHRRTPPDARPPHASTHEDPLRDRQADRGRASRDAARARRHTRARTQLRQAQEFDKANRAHGHLPLEARRHRQGWNRRGDQGSHVDPCQVHRCRRDTRGCPALRPGRVRRSHVL
ncbi:MAG: hypothetical protein KF705_03910 [Phycisphaeraceae bacterium]|nr:hypothetical protein [Phycisphaeraceae bacterium]